jgi:hypothetical protein
MKCVKQVFVAAIFFGCAAAVAQSGTIELPSISAEAGHIYVPNIAYCQELLQHTAGHQGMVGSILKFTRGGK